MSDSTNWNSCRIISAAVAAIAGLIVFLVARGAISVIAALLVGVGLGVILHVVLTRLFCADGRQAGVAPSRAGTQATPQAAPRPQATPEPEPAPEPEPEPEPAEPVRQTSEPESGAEEPAAERSAGGSSASPVRSGTQLPGEQDLAARKGEWRYEGAAKAAKAEAAGKAGRPDAETGSAADARAPGDAGGRRPQGLSAPREGGPDDLKMIKGIGPKLEQMLHGMGIYHFAQIAAWGPEEVAWMDANLKGFRGRVSRDRWVEQARILAEGGETEFSKRARDGGVY